MAGLQRSEVSFRRQGSSGIVWDDRFLSGELIKVNQAEDHHQDQNQIQNHKPDLKDQLNNAGKAPGSIDTTRSNARGYRTGRVSPAIEPPSPKLSACGFCGAFGKTGDKAQRAKPKPSKHRSR